MAMLLVFNQRIIDKLNYLIDDPEFDVIYETKSDINVHKIIFARNCLSLTGSSLVLNLGDLNFLRNQIIRKEKKSKKNNTDEKNDAQANKIEYLLKVLIDNLKIKNYKY